MTAEGQFLIKEYYVTEGHLSLTEIEGMESWKFDAWQAAGQAMAQKRENESFKSRNSK